MPDRRTDVVQGANLGSAVSGPHTQELAASYPSDLTLCMDTIDFREHLRLKDRLVALSRMGTVPFTAQSPSGSASCTISPIQMSALQGSIPF